MKNNPIPGRPRPPDGAPEKGRLAADLVTPVGLRPPGVTRSAAFSPWLTLDSHPDCRAASSGFSRRHNASSVPLRG